MTLWTLEVDTCLKNFEEIFYKCAFIYFPLYSCFPDWLSSMLLGRGFQGDEEVLYTALDGGLGGYDGVHHVEQSF